MTVLFATGLLSILGQVVLLRELSVSAYGVELVYLLAIGVWLIGTALGTGLQSRGLPPSLTSVALVLVVAGALIPLATVFVRGSRVLFGGVPGAYLPFPVQLAIIAIALVPVAASLGLLFRWGASLVIGAGTTLAAAYGVESLGGLVGGLVSTLLLRWGMQNFAQAALSALAAGLAATSVGWREARSANGPRRARWTLAAGVVASVLSAAAIWQGGQLDRRTTAWNHPQLVESLDTPYGRVTVTAFESQIAVFENDALSFESEGVDAELLAHLAALQHPSPRRVLLLGGVLEGLATELLLHGPERLDCVELDQRMFERVSARLGERARASLARPGVSLEFADPRRFLETAGRYDLIVIATGEPTSGRTNRFYTREFFERCADRLNPGGVVALRLRSAENVWVPLMAARNASIHRALRAAFANVLVLPGSTALMVASVDPLPADPEVLVARLDDRGIRARLVRPSLIRYLYTNDRRAQVGRLLEGAQAPASTDVRPVSYRYAAALWLSKFYPRIASIDLADLARGGAGTTWVSFGAGAVLAGVLVACRRRRLCRRVALVAVAGLVGMIVETVLLLDFQAAHGVLYQDIGILLTSFMGGLAAGAFAVHRRAVAIDGRRQLSRRQGGLILGAFALLCAIVAGAVAARVNAGLVGTAAALAGAGALVAAVFAYAGLEGEDDQARLVGPLYAADLAGGAVGALAGTLILIPLAGLSVTSAWMAAVCLLALLLV